MKDKIKRILEEDRATKKALIEGDLSSIEKAIESITTSLKKGGKLIVFGNGGSAADSQHMVAELVGRFKKERRALPAIALTTNTSSLTALSNDYGYEVSFKRQLEALGKKGDVAIAISTSGMARNVIEAIRLARTQSIYTIALTGKKGGKLKSEVDTVIVVDSENTPRIQESHIVIIHIMCEIIEDRFMSD